MAGELTGFCGDGTINGDEQCDGESWCDEECHGTAPPCASSATGCPDLEFVEINGGSFMMGDSRSEDPMFWTLPVHEVQITSFEMMRTEVTVAQYGMCVDDDFCTPPMTISNCNWGPTPRATFLPINCITWRQMMEFAAWVGARLPTEAEWEYAARSEGQDILYPWGDEEPSCDLANLMVGRSLCHGRTWIICDSPNGNTAQGLCDMSGNVSEWVQDKYHWNYEEAPSDGSGWCDGPCPENAASPHFDPDNPYTPVYRGGSYNNEMSDPRVFARLARWSQFAADSLGGRLARDLND